jgi:hypothetical protein
MPEVAETLAEREVSHGSYAHTANMAQSLKYMLARTQSKRSDVQNESLDMICTKLARICSGDNNCMDHWLDIAGYASLVVKNLEDKE